MNILAFDTCFGACSAAFVRGGEIVASKDVSLARGHSEMLLPMIEQVIASAETSLDDVDRFAVTNGPGTFAGVRVGIATVRALALATTKPVVAIGTLEAMAQSALMKTPALSGPFVVVRDARRDQVYAQSFHIEDSRVLPTMELPVVCAPGDLPGLLAGDIETAIGSGVGLVPWPADRAPDRIEGELEVSATAVAHLAMGRREADRPVSPLYLRAPDAKPQTGFALERQPTTAQ